MSDIVRETCSIHGEWFRLSGLGLGGCPSCQGNLDLAYPGQIAALTAERDHWKQEAEGYQRAVKECEDKDNKTAVILVWNGSEMRVFGPTPGQEQAMGETVAQYIKITKALVDDARIKALTAERDAARKEAELVRDGGKLWHEEAMLHKQRADEAEDEIARLRKALRTVADNNPTANLGHWEDDHDCVPHCARCILDSDAKPAAGKAEEP